MFGTRKCPLVTLAVVTALLAVAGPANAGIAVGNPGDPPARQVAHRPSSICAFPDVCRLAAMPTMKGDSKESLTSRR
jgi:hypothetical protein